MKHLLAFLQIFTGAALAVLVINDFFELLVEYLFNVSDFRLPIEFAKPEGWKLKFWLIDHPPAFDIYQILFFGTGFVLMIGAAMKYLPKRANLAIVGGLIFSALLVLLFPKLHYLTTETPQAFMIAQLLAGLALIPGVLNKRNISKIDRVGIYVASFLVLVLLTASIWKTPITLRYAVFPTLGLISIFVIQTVTKRKTISS